MLKDISYFFGAMFDALIGPNLIVMGEPFFIAAGYQLFDGAVRAAVLVLVGGYLGDQLSYIIGRLWGTRLQSILWSKQTRMRRPIARCRLILQRRPSAVIIGARLLGPVAWFMPFIVGTQRIAWPKFALLSAIGSLIGIGQFIAWGYMLAYGVEKFPLLEQAHALVTEYQMLLMVLLVTGTFLVAAYRFNCKKVLLKTSLIFATGVIGINYIHFFNNADDFTPSNAFSVPLHTPEINQLQLKVFPGHATLSDAQAMNVVFIGESPRQLMADIGWIENKTFSRDELSFFDYIGLLKDKTPPISDLFWQGQPQELAFQERGTLKTRSHIRWWQAGIDPVSSAPIWLGALSYDDGLSVTTHAGIVTLLLYVDPDVDAERDRFAKGLGHNINYAVSIKPLTSAVKLDDDHEYYSDGGVLIIECRQFYAKVSTN